MDCPVSWPPYLGIFIRIKPHHIINQKMLKGRGRSSEFRHYHDFTLFELFK